MPELPEIELLRRDLDKEVAGKRVKDAEIRPGSNAMKIIRHHGRRKEFQDLLTGARIEKLQRSGRKLLLWLHTGRVLVVELGESGRLLKTSSSAPIARHTHVVMNFTTGGQLRIVDPSRTAEVYVGTAEDVSTGDGPHRTLDPLESMPPWQGFSSLLGEHSMAMKELLTDEKFVCGLGDLYSDEILFVSGLRFDRASDSLTSSDVRRLYRGMGEVLQDALKYRGTSLGDGGFVDLHGEAGTFQDELKVFLRAGEACRRCRSTIVKQELQDRHTYFCPQCQA